CVPCAPLLDVPVARSKRIVDVSLKFPSLSQTRDIAMHKWPKDCESFVTGLPVAAFSSTSRPPRRFASAHLLGATMKHILRAAATLAVGVGGAACSSKHGEMPAADNLLISLALSPSNVSVPQGRTVPVAVTVVRAAGFTDPVTVSAGGLPNDVSASP